MRGLLRASFGGVATIIVLALGLLVMIAAHPAGAKGATRVVEQQFESGAAGWSFSGFWHIQANPQTISVAPAINPALVTLPDAGDLPAAFSGSHAAWYGEPSTGTFCGSDFAAVEANAEPKSGCISSAPNSGELTSPTFNLVGASSVRVAFMAWYEIEAVNADAFDLMDVEYSTDGGASWSTAGKLNPISNPAGSHDEPYSNNGLAQPGSWHPYIVDVSAAAGSPEARVRISFNTVDALYQGFRGLLIDDLSVETPFEGAPSLAAVQPACFHEGEAPIGVLSGSGFVTGSDLLVDEQVVPSAVVSSERIEFGALEGVHSLQVRSPSGALSNVIVTCPPAPKPPPEPEPAKGAPRALCDAYWVKEHGHLTVPAPGVLANDADPQGLPLTAHVDSISFGVKDHPYALDPKTGALSFTPNSTPGHKPSVATITYHVTNTLGKSSPSTTVQIYIQAKSPSAQVPNACGHGSPPVANPDSWTVPRGGTLLENVLANDSDVDGEPLTAEVLKIDFAADEWTGFGGLLQGDGEFLYTAGIGTSRDLTKTITYVAVDAAGNRSQPATAVIHVEVPGGDDEQALSGSRLAPRLFDPAERKGSCAKRIKLVSINGALSGFPDSGKCWSVIRLHGTDGATRCVLGLKPHDYGFDEVSAAKSEFKKRGALARKCTARARDRANCPHVGPCPAVGTAFYGYDHGFNPPWGFSAPVPGFGVKLLELYDGVAEDAVKSDAESRWKKVRKSYGAIVELGGKHGSTASIGATVKRVCEETRISYLGLYANTGQRPRAESRRDAVKKAIDQCTKS
ncbi:MAG TPA: Ig-like domain-containing protein [Solirubrobacterales bacterium]|nr:Ig-like domain-containing protein [Solirubrobacterales bacterium]